MSTPIELKDVPIPYLIEMARGVSGSHMNALTAWVQLVGVDALEGLADDHTTCVDGSGAQEELVNLVRCTADVFGE